MRIAGSIILAIAAGLAATPSHAQTYDPRWPVCMKVYGGGSFGAGEWVDCSFTSMPQCQASASGLGFCFANPYLRREPTRPQSRVYRQG